MDANRLELIISLLDDTQKGLASFQKHLKSMEQGAAESAARITKEFDGMTPAMTRSVDAWVRRSALAGKTGEDKIREQANLLKSRIGDGDKAVTDQIEAGTNAQVAAYRRRQAEVSRARQAAEEKSQAKLVSDLEERVQVAQGRRSTPVQRLEAEMGRVLPTLSEARRPEVEARYRDIIAAENKSVVDKQIIDRQNTIRDLEARASIAGKKTSERLGMELKDFTSNFKGTPEELKRGEEALKSLIATHKTIEAESSGHSVGGQAFRRILLGVKDFFEGSTRGAIIEGTDVLIGTSGSGGILQKYIPLAGEMAGVSTMAAYGVAGLTAAFVGLGIAGVASIHHLANVGQELKDFSLRTGIRPENVQHFQFAAKAEGADPALFERAFRGLAQATDEDSTSGAKARKELKDLGVDLYDDIGNLRPTEDIMLGIADGLKKLPPGLQASAASMEIFKRSGAELLPVLLSLRENVDESKKLGGTFTAGDQKMLDDWHKQIVLMGEEWDRFKANIALPLAIDTTVVLKFVTDWGGSRVPGTAQSRQTSLDFNPITRALGAMGLLYDETQMSQPSNPKSDPHLLLPPDAPERRSGRDILLGERGQVNAEINAFNARRLRDPKERLRQAQKELALMPVPEIGGKPLTMKQVRDYEAKFNEVEGLQQRSGSDANKGLQGVIAARQEGLNLDAQIAKQRVTDQAEILRAGMGSKSGLASQRDIEEELDLAKLAARAETASEVNKRQFRIDTKTGRKIDESSDPGFREFKRIQEQELEPKRVQEEYNKILTRMLVDSAKFYRSRTDESMKHYEEEWHRRQERELEVQGEISKIGNEISDRRTQFDIEANERAKNIAIESLGAVNKQTLKDKMSLEDQKFAIEKDYADRGLALQLQRLNTERARAIAEIEKKDRDRNIDPDTDPDTQKLIGLTNAKYQQDADALRAAAGDKELSDALKTAKAKEDLQIQSNRKIYDSLKQDAAGLFDQLVFHTKSWGAFAKDMLKSVVLTPIKEIFSSQVAGLFTGLFTGNKVTFDPLGTGKGRLGALEAAFGRAGGGQPNFHVPRETPFVSSKLESTVEGNAVRVIVTNPQQVGQAHVQALNSSMGLGTVGAALSGSFGSTILSGARTSQQQGLASSLFIPQSYGGESGVGAEGSDLASSFNNLIMSGAKSNQLQGFGNAYSDTAGYGTSPNGFATMGEIAGIGSPQGIFSSPTPPPFVDQNLSGVQLADWTNANLGPEAAMASPSGSGGGNPMGGIMNAGLMSPGGLKAFLGQNALGTDVGGGMAIANTAMLGHLAAFGKSGAAAMIGGMLVMDSLSRKPGKASAVETPLGAGMLGFKFGGTTGAFIGAGLGLATDGLRRGGFAGVGETAAGGALIGARLGGPLGALVGGAIGAGAGLFRMMFETDRAHTKKLAKQIYGMDINNATADSIIQIAKQTYGGQIDVAMRSQQVRDLLKLYSQATGQKSVEDQFAQSTIHGASLVEANGKLMQQAVYDNGNAYAYSSQLGTYQGVQTSPLSTYAPNNGVFSGNVQINLNGQSAADVLEGRVTNVVTPGFVQGKALAAGNASIGRASQTRMTLSPSAIPG